MKTMKYFLSMAALALVGAMMTGCSNDDLANESVQQPVVKDNIVTVTTTVGLSGGEAAARVTNRALAADGTKTFAVGERVALAYWRTDIPQWDKALSQVLTVDNISADGKTAKLTFTMTNPEENSSFHYCYPAAMADIYGFPDYSNLSTQDGTLASLSANLDLATGDGMLSGTNLPANVPLINNLAILAITLKNSGGSSEITSAITDMTISDGTNSYAVTRSAAAGPIYVAIRPTDDANIDITATDGSKNYTKSLTGKTYAADNGYNVSWRMAEAYRMAANATTEDKGKLICTDGHIHAYNADAACTKDRVAKIIYVGTTGHATYTHGLALALADEGQMDWSAACTACNITKNTSTPVTDATWLLANMDQWDYMLGTYGAGSYTALRYGFTSVGGTNMVDNLYWSSTGSSDRAWGYYFYNGGSWLYEYKTSKYYYVRSALAF